MGQRILNRAAEFLAIKAREERRRITRRTMAKEIGLSERKVYRYVDNQIERQDLSVLLKFCEYFNCTMDELLIIEGEGNPAPETINPMLATA